MCMELPNRIVCTADLNPPTMNTIEYRILCSQHISMMVLYAIGRDPHIFLPQYQISTLEILAKL